VFAIGQCGGHFHRSEQPIQKKCRRVAAKRQYVGGTGRAHAYGEETGGTVMWEVSCCCEIYGCHGSSCEIPTVVRDATSYSMA
jgi:hypothetical protein